MSEGSNSLLPPLRFALVQEHLYRGAYPTLPNFRFLRRLNLQTIISLTPEKPLSDLKQYCKVNDINHVHVRVSIYKEAVTLLPQEVARLLEIMINPDCLPLYIHCLDGKNITGLVVACLRHLQNYHTNFIYSEFKRFTSDLVTAEQTFVTKFSEPVCIPVGQKIPVWLWDGRRIKPNEHPSIPILFEQTETGTQAQTLNVNDSKHDEPHMSFGCPVESNERESLAYYDTLLCPITSNELRAQTKQTKSRSSAILQALGIEGLTMIVESSAPQRTHYMSDVCSELSVELEQTTWPLMPSPVSPMSFMNKLGSARKRFELPAQLLFMERITGNRDDLTPDHDNSDSGASGDDMGASGDDFSFDQPSSSLEADSLLDDLTI